jgi:methyl-accepting chemotaxis protein
MSPTSIRRKLLFLFLFIFILIVAGSGFFLTKVRGIDQEIDKISSLALSDNNAMDSVSAGNNMVVDKTESSPFTESLNAIGVSNKTMYWGLIVFVFVITGLLVSGSYWIIRSLMRSLRDPVVILTSLVQGDTSVSIKPKQDEFHAIAEAANQLGENLKRSSTFAQSIGEGNFDFDFKPVSDQDTLGNSLVQMREKLRTIADADRKRNWTSEGLAKFADIIRKGDDQQKLSDTLISELVKYTKANQGGLFVLNHDNEKDPFLEMAACYAYERKKHMSKRIDLGSGLLGQCFMEGEAVYLTQVPDQYVSITSGLGTGNPRSLLLVPLKLNESTEGVIELASFQKFETHEIDFVKQVGEIIASAISTARVSDRTKKMLAESQQQSEEMRSQEEEMRQNMEEMQATQEAMERQTAEMKKMQVNLELEKSMFNVLMEFLPDRITYKDTESRILRINKAKAERLKMAPEEVIGKTDYDFFTKEHAEKAMREEKALIDSGRPLMDIEERLVFNNGDVAWVSTSRIPFKNEHNKTTGMFIITKDVTNMKIAQLSLKDRELMLQTVLKHLPILHYKVDKTKKIYEAWAGENVPALFVPEKIMSKPLQELFPEVLRTIESWKGEQDRVCEEKANSRTLRNYIFSDSIHPGVYWVFAIVN